MTTTTESEAFADWLYDVRREASFLLDSEELVEVPEHLAAEVRSQYDGGENATDVGRWLADEADRPAPKPSLSDFFKKQEAEHGRQFHQLPGGNGHDRPFVFAWNDPYDTTGESDIRVYVQNDTFRVKVGV